MLAESGVKELAMASVPPSAYYPPHNFTAMTPVPAQALGPAAQHVSCSQVFRKAEPKAMGVVQIMIGLMTLLFGIVLTVAGLSFIYYTGCTIWASVLYISAGAVTIAATNSKNPCVIKASLVLNVISAVAAGVALILLSINVAVGHFVPLRYGYYYSDSMRDGYKYNYNYNYQHIYAESMFVQSQGISGVLLVFCLLQFIVSIWISAFGCKATCCSQPTHMYVVPNSNSPYPVMQNPASAPVIYQQTVPV